MIVFIAPFKPNDSSQFKWMWIEIESSSGFKVI